MVLNNTSLPVASSDGSPSVITSTSTSTSPAPIISRPQKNVNDKEQCLEREPNEVIDVEAEDDKEKFHQQQQQQRQVKENYSGPMKSSKQARKALKNVKMKSEEAQPPPPPPPPPLPQDVDVPHSSPIIRFMKRNRATLTSVDLSEEVKSVAESKRFWFFFGIFLSFIISLLVTPTALHATGVTETDLLQTFFNEHLFPLMESKAAGPRVGAALFAQGARAKHPVFLLPGFTSTGLELWEGTACAQSYFRQRVWGSTSMMTTFLADRECWLRHMALNATTGLDPEGIRIRPAQGFEAADYIISSYWVWARMIQNLADVGYDGTNMEMKSFDWRLSAAKLESRDNYFTKLKASIEVAYATSNEKAVILSHSMGGNHALFFLNWVETSKRGGGGGGGSRWVNKHIAANICIAAPYLGVPKALPVLLSGESRDSAALSPFEPILQNFFSRTSRKRLFHSWGAAWSMMIKGGDAFWGDDNFITATDGNKIAGIASNISAQSLADSLYANNTHHGAAQVEKMNDPLLNKLPYAPQMQQICIYGVGLNTEVGYFFKSNKDVTDSEEIPFVIDVNAEGSPGGIKFGDGDATVPLISLGFMCRRGWTDTKLKLNPSKMKVITREYESGWDVVNDPFRSGRLSADHVDIMGNDDVIKDVLLVLTGHASVDDRIISSIDEEVQKIKI
jgi:phospholipid:diacylglycerol acyltransferase